MKRFMVGSVVLIMLVWSTSVAQESTSVAQESTSVAQESTLVAQALSIGPTAGALFTQGSRGHASGMHGTGFGTSFSFGGEVVYSLSSVPLDLVGQASYTPIDGRYHMRDSLVTAGGEEGHQGHESSLFSLGLGGRWVPLRGPVSPYLGVFFLLSHQEGSAYRHDSTQAAAEPAGHPETPDHPNESGGGGSTTRFGVGLSVGSEFVLSSLIRLDVGASYALYTPFERGGNLSTIGFGASVLFTLF